MKTPTPLLFQNLAKFTDCPWASISSVCLVQGPNLDFLSARQSDTALF